MRIIETILISRNFLLYIINNASSKAIFFKKMSSKPPPQQVLYNYYLLRGALFICLFHGTYQISIISLLQIYKIILFSQKPREKKNSKWNNKKCIKSDILTQKRSDEWGAPVLLRYLIPRLFVIQITTTHFRIIM